MTYTQKLAKIESLYPGQDWVTKKLDSLIEPLQAKIDASTEGVDDFFGALDAAAFALTPDESALHERIRLTLLRRYAQLSKRQDAIRATFTLDELEQQVIA